MVQPVTWLRDCKPGDLVRYEYGDRWMILRVVKRSDTPRRVMCESVLADRPVDKEGPQSFHGDCPVVPMNEMEVLAWASK